MANAPDSIILFDTEREWDNAASFFRDLNWESVEVRGFWGVALFRRVDTQGLINLCFTFGIHYLIYPLGNPTPLCQQVTGFNSPSNSPSTDSSESTSESSGSRSETVQEVEAPSPSEGMQRGRQRM